ncbi:putative serine/arginine repetitive matrix protein 1 isoform X1 [Iris pallida]|uniref:Serine/arginine repetitive matrix protein 1 isoform X1 n=1 Tax=Iris pallida TaxID=29817 RepID=A0AAX6H8W8_IRIPA|nr:putative serine/arginine repetitive matrix protein 1 isoform X1 [Iris pallida]
MIPRPRWRRQSQRRRRLGLVAASGILEVCWSSSRHEHEGAHLAEEDRPEWSDSERPWRRPTRRSKWSSDLGQGGGGQVANGAGSSGAATSKGRGCFTWRRALLGAGIASDRGFARTQGCTRARSPTDLIAGSWGSGRSWRCLVSGFWSGTDETARRGNRAVARRILTGMDGRWFAAAFRYSGAGGPGHW